MGRQQSNQRPSVSSYSTLEGAAGGVDSHRTSHPQFQRMTKKNQQGSKPQQVMQPQEFGNMPNNQVYQDNYFQGPHNTTTYMNLLSAVQKKICGRCGLVGHLKRHCKEEVYCKYCRTTTHMTTACRTYPVTSSRKNTPEKNNTDKIEREVNRRVQEEMRNILDNLQFQNQATKHAKRQMDAGQPYQHIPMQGQAAQDLVGDFDRPTEVYDHFLDNTNVSINVQRGQNADLILNQQWEDQPQMQPPLMPTNTPVSQQNDESTSQNYNRAAGGTATTRNG